MQGIFLIKLHGVSRPICLELSGALDEDDEAAGILNPQRQETNVTSCKILSDVNL